MHNLRTTHPKGTCAVVVSLERSQRGGIGVGVDLIRVASAGTLSTFDHHAHRTLVTFSSLLGSHCR